MLDYHLSIYTTYTLICLVNICEPLFSERKIQRLGKLHLTRGSLTFHHTPFLFPQPSLLICFSYHFLTLFFTISQIYKLLVLTPFFSQQMRDF